ncbi:hypothetical protein ACFOZ6_16215, partial [Actinoplanes siamensis]
MLRHACGASVPPPGARLRVSWPARRFWVAVAATAIAGVTAVTALPPPSAAAQDGQIVGGQSGRCLDVPASG